MADIGDEIREYIANLASPSAGAAQEQAANTMGKSNQFDTMAAQIKALTDAVAKLAAMKENKDPNAGKGGGKNGDRTPTNDEAMEHGSILSLPWFPSGRGGP